MGIEINLNACHDVYDPLSAKSKVIVSYFKLLDYMCSTSSDSVWLKMAAFHIQTTIHCIWDIYSSLLKLSKSMFPVDKHLTLEKIGFSWQWMFIPASSFPGFQFAAPSCCSLSEVR